MGHRPPIRGNSTYRAIIGVLALLILLVGGCGGDDGASGDDATPTSGDPAASATPTEPPATPTESPATATSASEEVGADLPRAEPPGIDSPETAAFVDGLNGFAFDLYQAVIEDEDGNLIYSPTSIELAFSMVYAGARGETESQMAEVLGFLPQEEQHPAANALDQHLAALGQDATPGMEQGEPFQLNIANAIWGQEGYTFLDAFLETLAAHYGAGLRIADFATAAEDARQEINAWIEDRTEGRIEEAVPEGAIDEATRLVLANAIYFSAGWLFPFDESNTADGAFTLLDGSQVTVPMMRQDAVRMPYADGDGYQAALIPYTGQSVDMLVILPEAGRFEEIEANLSPVLFDELRAEAETHDVALAMPQFDFESQLDLTTILPEMGMPDPFGPADFSGITGTADLFIATALHHATIAVDEKGTEAAAVTVIGMEESAMPRAEITLDRPFIFAIVERETGAVLFMGRVVNPAA